MKITDRENIRLRKVGRNYMILRESKDAVNMNDVYTLNETAAFLMERAKAVESFDEAILAAWLIEEYGIDQTLADTDVHAICGVWKEVGLLED